MDTSIRDVGYLPEANANGNGLTHPRNGNGNGHTAPRNGNGNGHGEAWNCTPKQQDLIIKIVDENRLDRQDIERLAMDRFGKGVKQLNKLEASGFIEELFERHPRQWGNGNGRAPSRTANTRRCATRTAPCPATARAGRDALPPTARAPANTPGRWT